MSVIIHETGKRDGVCALSRGVLMPVTHGFQWLLFVIAMLLRCGMMPFGR